mgnify:CR=1 FL=1
MLNNCGKTITLVDNNYYYCMPMSDNKKFCFAKLGNLEYNNYIDFTNKNKCIIKMLNNDINENDIIEKCCVGYGICDLCKNLYKED